MQYDLTNSLDKEKFKVKCNALYKKGAVVELTEKVFRTPNQNRYLHLLLGVVAMETGNTIEDVKREYFKNLVNPEIFRSYKTDTRGNTIAVFRSIVDVSQEEMSQAIDRFKRWASENGIYLPSPGDEERLKDIEIQIGRMKNYL